MTDKKETASTELKDGLADCYTGSKAKDWKRVSKAKSGNGVKRLFKNENMGIEVVVYGDEGDDFGSFNEAGKMLFFAEDLPEEACEEYDVESGCMVMFAAETFWNRNHYIPDNHISPFLADHYGLDLSDFDEMCENQFLVDAPASEVIAMLEAKGLRHEPEMKRAGQWDADGDEDDDDDADDAVVVEPGLSSEAAVPGQHRITTAFIVKNIALVSEREIWTFDGHLDANPSDLDPVFGPEPRQNNMLFRFRSLRPGVEESFDYTIAYAPDGTEGSLTMWNAPGGEYLPTPNTIRYPADEKLFTKQWKRAPEQWTVDRRDGGLEMWSSPVQYPPYEDGGPVTDEAILAALHEAFDRPGWLTKPMSSDWTLIPGLGDELRTRYNGKGHMGKLRMYQGKINGVPTKAAVFSPDERDAKRLEVCEYDEVVYFGFHDPEDADGDNIVWAGMRSQVEREGCSDQHQSYALEALCGWPGDEFDEGSENYFEDKQGRSRDDIKARLEGLGYVFKEGYDAE